MTDILAIDGDWGGDELSMLSVLVAHSKLPVRLLSAVAGNAGCEYVTENMLDIASWLGQINLPAFPCFDQNKAFDGAHGNNGMGSVSLPIGHRQISAETDFAVTGLSQLLDKCPSNTAVIFATGPLTNIAKVLDKNPAYADKIKALLIMGGAMQEISTPHGQRRGNITPYAEFNFYSDPQAAATVLTTMAHKVTLFPIDCTQQMTFTPERESIITNLALPEKTKEILVRLLNVPSKIDRDKFGIDATLHDVHVGLYYLFPKLYQIESDKVCIIQQGDEVGKSELCAGGADINIARNILDSDKAFHLIAKSFERNLGDFST